MITEAMAGLVVGLARGVLIGLAIMAVVSAMIGAGKLLVNGSIWLYRRLCPPPPPPPVYPAYRFYYDFQICSGREELVATVASINTNGYNIVSVTQHEDTFVLFFRRFGDG